MTIHQVPMSTFTQCWLTTLGAMPASMVIDAMSTSNSSSHILSIVTHSGWQFCDCCRWLEVSARAFQPVHSVAFQLWLQEFFSRADLKTSHFLDFSLYWPTFGYQYQVPIQFNWNRS